LTKLNWTKGPADPDPARVVTVGDYGAMSDEEVAAFRKKLAAQSLRGVKKASGSRVRLETAMRSDRKQCRALSKRIQIVERSGKADADAFIHQTALMALRQADQHGDAAQALRLVMAMPNGSRRERLVQWFRRFSPVVIDTKKKTCRLRARDAKAGRTFDFRGAEETPFYLL